MRASNFRSIGQSSLRNIRKYRTCASKWMTGSIFLTKWAVVRKIPSIGCDENGCYYSSDNEPKGWFWVKSNNEVIYFSQDYAPKTFLASDRNLSWLMA